VGVQIDRVTATPGVGAFFADDQAAITAGAPSDGFAYDAEPRTPGFDRVREPGEALLVDLTLSNGRVVRGDCAAVQYAAAGDRDPLFRARAHAETVEKQVAAALVGRDAGALETNAAVLEELTVHSAVAYGVSQALVAAAAATRETTRTRALADALRTAPASSPVAVFGQSGAARRRAAEKMLLKRVPVLPHGLFNSLETVGPEGGRLIEYLSWLSGRATELGGGAYRPRFHVDIYGMLEQLFGPPYDRPAPVEYVGALQRAAAPYPLQLEEPMIAASRADQIAAMSELQAGLADAGVDVDLVADEWCDRRADIEAFGDAGAADVVQVKTPDVGSVLESGRAVRYCAGTDTRAYLGGTCNETALSARTSAHVALATDAAQLLAKPGMGFDEGYAVVTNEMRRTLTRHRRPARPGDQETD
jgi:methylaspartate ammonia-lyase